MSSTRVRLALLYAATVVLFGLSGLLLGVPGAQRIAGDESEMGWLLLIACLLVDISIIAIAMLLSRRAFFKSDPIDATVNRQRESPQR